MKKIIGFTNNVKSRNKFCWKYLRSQIKVELKIKRNDLNKNCTHYMSIDLNFEKIIVCNIRIQLLKLVLLILMFKCDNIILVAINIYV